MDREGGRGVTRNAGGNRVLRRERRAAKPMMENLEGRLLLTRAYPFPTVPPNVRNVIFDRAVYTIAIDGPGVLRARPSGQGSVNLDLLGTTDQTVVSIARRNLGPHAPFSALPLNQIDVRTGRLGALVAGNAADLVGTMSSIVGGMSVIQVNAIGPDARVEVLGDLGQLSAGSVSLGPAGRVRVAGDLGTMTAGSVNLDGGMLLVDQSIVGDATIGELRAVNGGRLATGDDVTSLTITGGAQISHEGTLAVGDDLGGLEIGRDLSINLGGRLEVGGDVTGRIGVGGGLGMLGGRLTVGTDLGGLWVSRDTQVGEGGFLLVGRDLSGPVSFGNTLLVDGSFVGVGRDVIGPMTVDNDLILVNDATLAVGRDVRQPLVVGNDLVIAGDANLLIGRNVWGFEVGGNLDTSGVGVVAIGGNLNDLRIDGALIGKGVVGDPDLAVGLDLNGLTVLGFVPTLGSIVNADISIEKSLVGLDARHGIFNSFLTAGVLIDGGEETPSGGNIGPDGPIAVLNSQIRAGVQIRNLLINGDVVSTAPSDPTALPTRIVAGQNRAGVFSPAGNIDNFQITGSLIDAVIAASVVPEGGHGNIEPVPTDINGDGTYDAPAGFLPFGTYGNPGSISNNAPAGYNEFYQFLGYFYDPADPVIDDLILPGAINASFAPTVPSPNEVTPDTRIPLPTKSTVLGGVITTAPPSDDYDSPGFFAADTRGVFVGTLPS